MADGVATGHQAGPVRLANTRGGIKKSRNRLKTVAVLGIVQDSSVEEEELQEYVVRVTGKRAKQIQIKKDRSFMITKWLV